MMFNFIGIVMAIMLEQIKFSLFRNSEKNKTLFDKLLSISIGETEGKVEKKLRETGEWIIDRTEKGPKSTGMLLYGYVYSLVLILLNFEIFLQNFFFLPHFIYLFILSVCVCHDICLVVVYFFVTSYRLITKVLLVVVQNLHRGRKKKSCVVQSKTNAITFVKSRENGILHQIQWLQMVFVHQNLLKGVFGSENFFSSVVVKNWRKVWQGLDSSVSDQVVTKLALKPHCACGFEMTYQMNLAFSMQVAGLNKFMLSVCLCLMDRKLEPAKSAVCLFSV